MTFQISNPIGASFAVVIKNSSDVTVYSATHGNEIFDPAITTPDDYTMYIDGGTTPVYCFTVSECECPVLDGVRIEMGTGGIFFGYAYFDFDMSGGMGCAFTIAGNVYADVGAPTLFSFTISSLSDFTSNVGDIYTKQIWIGGFATYIDYTIQIPASVSGGDAIPCYEGTAAPDCTSPNLIEFGGTGLYSQVLYSASPLAWGIGMISTGCGAATCTTATINYIQINPGIIGTPDSGTVTGHNLCPNGLTYFAVTPNTSYPGYDPSTNFPRYSVTITDCCGVIYESATTLIGGAMP